jgi:hypothetical protein
MWGGLALAVVRPEERARHLLLGPIEWLLYRGVAAVLPAPAVLVSHSRKLRAAAEVLRWCCLLWS